MKVYDEINNTWVSHRCLPEYYYRKRKLKDFWLFFTGFMCFMPIALILVLTLLGCFLSFMFLDEMPYKLGDLKVRE